MLKSCAQLYRTKGFRSGKRIDPICASRLQWKVPCRNYRGRSCGNEVFRTATGNTTNGRNLSHEKRAIVLNIVIDNEIRM